MKVTRHAFLGSLGATAALPLDAFAQARTSSARPSAGNGPAHTSGTLSFAQSDEDLIADFVVRGSTFVNTLFVDGSLLG
jgi:hypothetical protein